MQKRSKRKHPWSLRVPHIKSIRRRQTVHRLPKQLANLERPNLRSLSRPYQLRHKLKNLHSLSPWISIQPHRKNLHDLRMMLYRCRYLYLSPQNIKKKIKDLGYIFCVFSNAINPELNFVEHIIFKLIYLILLRDEQIFLSLPTNNRYSSQLTQPPPDQLSDLLP